ncbi:unnamed protein product, partial [Iphiclides podalirius]
MVDKALNESKYIDHPLLKDKIKKMSEHLMLSKFPLQAEFFFLAYELLEKPENITSDKLRQAYYVACASELNDLTEYMDVNQTMTLKSNTDIINGKCTWTAVAALKHFNAEQRKIFEECYNSSDPEKIKRVLRLYDEVNMRDLYRKEEKARYDLFLEKVSKLPADSVPSPDFFITILRYFQSYTTNISRYYYI